MNLPPAPRSKSVLITGVSTGIGRGMTRKLVDEGYRVFGSVRTHRAAEEAQRHFGPSFVPLVFDVCEQPQVESASRAVRDALAGEPLFALVNNAGSAEIGPLLGVRPEELTRQLDVLVVGQLRVIQCFYPCLGPGSETPGRIVNISSLSGVGANRFFGGYTAGKHALEGLSKTLRDELKSSGIQVIVVAPGNIATDIWPKQTSERIERYAGSEYYEGLRGALRYIEQEIVPKAMSVAEFSDAFYEVLTAPDPGERYTIVKFRRSRIPLSRYRVHVIEG